MITVTGTILGPDDSPVVGEVVFHPLSTPTFQGGFSHLSAMVRVETDTEGKMRWKFSPGFYDVESHVNGSRVSRNPVKRFRIEVPADIGGDSNAEAEISTLVTEEDPGTGVPPSGGLATPSVYGTVKLDQADTGATVITKRTITGADGMGVIFRPIAGKAYLREPSTGLYYELVVAKVLGTPALGINSTGLTFAALPTA